MSEEFGGLAVGIPQITKTSERWPSVTQMNKLRKQIRTITASKALNPQEKRRRIDNANIQIVKLARQAVKTFRRAS